MKPLEERVSKAKALLILDHPFFGAAVSRRPIKYGDMVPTAGMSATGQMYLNPEWCEPLNTKQLMFLMAHEALHYMLCHATRRKGRDPQKWNYAADQVINDTLIDAKVGEFIDGGVTLDGGRNHAAEELYQDLDKEGDGSGQAPGGIGMDIGDPTDEDGNPLDEAGRNELEARVKVEMIQAAKVAKAMGKLSAGVERLVDELVNVKTPWHEILERFMATRVRDGHSWNRPNRRFVGQGIYLPGYDYTPRMGEVVIGVDTSGSIGMRELAEFNGHINRILEACGPEKVHVVYCDSRVAHVDEYTPDDFPVKLSPHGGGGTAFDPVFAWVDEQGLEPECVVYLTDGYGNQNSFDSPAYDTVWLTTGRTDFNWGLVVEFEPGEAS